MSTYTTPGVYVEEISKFPPSVAQVPTAIPAFIGCTESGPKHVATRITSLKEFEQTFGGPKKVKFSVDVQEKEIKPDAVEYIIKSAPATLDNNCILYYCLQLYFSNGGGPCYIVSIGDFNTNKVIKTFTDGVDILKKVDEPTLIVLPEAAYLSSADYGKVIEAVLIQCALLKDRFGIFDYNFPEGNDNETLKAFRGNLGNNNLKYGAVYTPYLHTVIPYVYDENNVSIEGMEAVFSPVKIGNEFDAITNDLPSHDSTKADIDKATEKFKALKAKIDEAADLLIAGANKIIDSQQAQPDDETFDPEAVKIASTNIGNLRDTKSTAQDALNTLIDVNALKDPKQAAVKKLNNCVSNLKELLGGSEEDGVPKTLAVIEKDQTQLYNNIKAHLAKQRIVLPPSSAMAGIYAQVDRQRGVWKAPANVSVSGVMGPVAQLTNEEQGGLNIDPTTGKSINVIRNFAGKGSIVWGARTLAGNDNEWRYVNVRRLFITIEESVQKATAFAVFEPNDATTWLKVKAMIDSYLYGLWQQGALAGATPEDSYYVHVGLGKTMTPQDILEGNMIVEIGIAAVRPAEFIILKFSHKLQES